MEFWNSLLTGKSWRIMQELKKQNFRFIVIGGWAAYLWTKQHKSKDIDIVIPDYVELEAIGKKYALNKNDNLKKYEIKFDDIDVDMYLPYYSKLALPLKELLANTTKVEGFEVVKPEILLILKQGAELDRKDSIKGQKDRIDIMTLLCFADVDFKKYKELLSNNKLHHFKQRLKEIVISFTEIKYLGLNTNDYAKIKKKLLDLV